MSGMPVPQKILNFSFRLVLNAPKKFSGHFATIEPYVSRPISGCTFSIYIIYIGFYGYKLFLKSYTGLKIKKSSIPVFSPIRERVKQV